MAKRKKENEEFTNPLADNVHIQGAGHIKNEAIVDTLTSNFMPYAMSVILSRAIPEIDGFKPSHRKLLYTMYSMGLLQGGTVKSANIVGRTMQLNPHGDASIYETMIRLSRGNESLLYPFVDSKGNFGKAYSKNMMYAASRYTEAKLAPISKELFEDINKDTVDFVDNYDNTMKEPTLLPVTFPTILCNVTTGIAAGMASSIASFNLGELCDTTISLIKNPDHDVNETLLAPDFVSGGYVVYDREELEKIYSTGRGSVKVRAKYTYDKKFNCIDITEIPPTTTSEAIIDKIVELVKANKIRELSDLRDETDLKGLRITLDLKRGTDPEKLMAKLYKMTPLEDTFSCNFNVLIKGSPKVLGVRDILLEWIDFRLECVRRRTQFTLNKKSERLHLLKGLEKILLDIDKAIKIIRNTEAEADVVPNLMIGFGIDRAQAEYVAEIKLRHLNREYILKRTKDIEDLIKEIAELEAILASKNKLKRIIVNELAEVSKKYSGERKCSILYSVEEFDTTETVEIPDYPVTLFITKEGYLNKIRTANLRMSGEQKVKEGDEVSRTFECSNKDELLVFTDKAQVYKAKVDDFPDGKASQLGTFAATKLGMEPDEKTIYMCVIREYKGYMIFAFENGKIAKVDITAYQTKANRKKLLKAYSAKVPLASVKYIEEDCELVLCSTSGRMLLLNTGALNPKTTKDTQGVSVMTQKKNHKLESMHFYREGEFEKAWRFRTKNLPAAGALPSPADNSAQLSF